MFNDFIKQTLPVWTLRKLECDVVLFVYSLVCSSGRWGSKLTRVCCYRQKRLVVSVLTGYSNQSITQFFLQCEVTLCVVMC